MHLGTASINSKTTVVVLLASGDVLDIVSAAGSFGDQVDTNSLLDMHSIIEAGDAALSTIASLLVEAEAGEHKAACHSLANITLLAPIVKPRKNVFCVGRNYEDHIAEGNKARNQNNSVTEHPVYFTKPPTSVVGPDATVPIFPSVSKNIDYEVELSIVMGKPGRNIAKEHAYQHIFGYTIINDITARDVQRRHGGQFFKGKSFDGSCPTGPWIVTADAISDPHNLAISLSVNGQMRQQANTRLMIFDIPTIVASLSEGLTLEPGDLIATGTPSGVGFAMDPPCYLQHGDNVTCHIETIGTLSNTLQNTSDKA